MALILLCWLQLMLDLLKTAEEKKGVIGALTFGVQLLSGWQAFPSSPTWLLHDSGEAVRRCYANVPVLIRTSTFCEACCCSSIPCPPGRCGCPCPAKIGDYTAQGANLPLGICDVLLRPLTLTLDSADVAVMRRWPTLTRTCFTAWMPG